MDDAVPPALVAYMDMWNETDLAAVRGHVERVFTPDAVFCDPLHEVSGHDEITAMVVGTRKDFPGSRYSLTSAVDGHHRRHRYHWLAEMGEGTSLPGFDVTLLAEDGRIARVDGFFEELART